MNPYPAQVDKDSVVEVLERIVAERQKDIKEFENQFNIYTKQVLNGRIPTSNSDVQAGDTLNGVVNDGTYEYKLLNLGGGSYKWDRRALTVGW